MKYLRALRAEDADGMQEWMQDPDIQNNFREGMEKRTREDILDFIRTADTIFRDGGSVHYAVVDDTDEYMGTISLKEINLTDRHAEYAVCLRKKAQGKGLAKEATEELLRLAFEENGLHRVYLNVLSENRRAIRFYEKLGFRLEGESVDHLFLRGAYHSLRWYAVLADREGE